MGTRRFVPDLLSGCRHGGLDLVFVGGALLTFVVIIEGKCERLCDSLSEMGGGNTIQLNEDYEICY